MHKFLLIFLLPLCLHASSESMCRRVQAHLLIGDHRMAVKEAQEGLVHYPKDPKIFEAALKSFSAAGEEGAMVALWEEYHAQFPKAAMEQEVLEVVCWGILRKGQKAPGVATQLISVIGAAMAQDMYAVPFLMQGLRHSNAHLRAISVQLASLYGDLPLRNEIVTLFYREQNLEVRLEVLKAVASLRMEELLPALMARVSDPRIGSKEKFIVIQAIVNMRETLDHEELDVLLHSKRAALRELACEAITHCELREEVGTLEALLLDPHPDVQASALKGLGVMRFPPNSAVKQLAKEARYPQVGILASWVWLLAEPERGEEIFSRWFAHKNKEVQALAASAVAAAGKYGTELARHYLEKAQDPYVRVNLALALIGQREACDEACRELDTFLATQSEKLMFSEEGLFRTLQKSTVVHRPGVPNFPEVVNQTVRLEMINLLAILEHPGAQGALKTLLKQRQWGVTGLAAETLLGEGDETAIEHVRALLEERDPEIRAEAALVLAVWGRDASALPHLLEVYSHADRQLQVKILEALGRIGNREALPFLIERLKEPSLMLRMIAATVLIQTLNS